MGRSRPNRPALPASLMSAYHLNLITRYVLAAILAAAGVQLLFF
jgi:hypothetical protein